MANKLADGGKSAGIGGRIAARGAPDRRLVDIDDLVDMLRSGDVIAVTAAVFGMVKDLGQPFVEDIGDQGALTAAGNTGDADELTERNSDIDILEVVLPGALDNNSFSRCRGGASRGEESLWRR